MRKLILSCLVWLMPLPLAAQDWLALERDLAALYLPVGVVNGEIDEQTQEAIRLFQYSFGFPVKNRLTAAERGTLGRAARAAGATAPFVFEEERTPRESIEHAFLRGDFSLFGRELFANGPHFMARRTATPDNPENQDVPSTYFTKNTERVAAYSEQAEAISVQSGNRLAPAIFVLTRALREDPEHEITVQALDEILTLAEANQSETAMTALLTKAAQTRFRSSQECRTWDQADRLSNLLTRAVVVARASGLPPHQWAALVQRAIDCAPPEARDGLFQLRFEQASSVSAFARREVLIAWGRDAALRGQDDQARTAFSQAMELLYEGPSGVQSDVIFSHLIAPHDAVTMARLGMNDAAAEVAAAHVDFLETRPLASTSASRAELGGRYAAELDVALMLLDLGDSKLLGRMGRRFSPTVEGADPTVVDGAWFMAQLGMRHLGAVEEYSRLVQVGLDILPDVEVSGDQKAAMMFNLMVSEAAAELGDFDLAEKQLTNVLRIAALNNTRLMIEDRVVAVQKRLSLFQLANMPIAKRVVQQLETYYGDDCQSGPDRDESEAWQFPKIDFASFTDRPDFRNEILASEIIERLVACTPADVHKKIPIRALSTHQARAFCAIAAINGRADLVESVLNAKNAAQPDLLSSIWCIYGLTDVGITSWMDRAGWAQGGGDLDVLYNLMIASPEQRRDFLAYLDPGVLPQQQLNHTPWADLELRRAPELRKKLLQDYQQVYSGSFGSIGPTEEDFEQAYLAGIAFKKLGLVNLAEAAFYLDGRIDPFRFGAETPDEIAKDLLDIQAVNKRLEYAKLYRASGQFDRARAAISPLVELAVERLSSSENPLPGTVEQWSDRLSDAFRLYLNLQFDPGTQQPNYHSIFLVQQFIQAARSSASLSVLEQRLNSSLPEVARAYQDNRRVLRAMMQDPSADPRAIEEATERLRLSEAELSQGDAALQGHQIGVIRPLPEAMASLRKGEAMLVVTQLEDVLIQTLLTRTTAQAQRKQILRYDAIKQVRAFRDSITTSTQETDRFDARSARDLYDYMLGWALKRSVPANLKIIADSPWATLPFGALRTGDGWLAQTTAIELSPSVARSVSASAGRAQSGSGPAGGFIGIGDPDLAAYGRRPGVSAQAALAELPETKNELTYMAINFKGNPSTDVFIRDKATESTIRQLDADNRLQNARVLALATHGLLSRDVGNGGGAALVLSDPMNGTDDGFMSAAEIYTYRIGAELVILSACNTGTPDAANGLSDLASAFFYAGAGKLLLTHWEIDSGAAVELMRTFANDFGRGHASPSESLRFAIHEMLGNPVNAKYSHPRFWASHFVIS